LAHWKPAAKERVMSSEHVMLVKVLYIIGLLILGLTLMLAVQQGVDAQVEALPYYADVWGG
jgi:hypothetical protein